MGDLVKYRHDVFSNVSLGKGSVCINVLVVNGCCLRVVIMQTDSAGR